MAYQGSSEEQVRWPSEKRVWTISALFFAVALMGLAAYVEYRQFTPLERWWFPDYLKMHLLLGVGSQFGDYRLLEAVGRNRKVIVVLDSEDVTPGETQVQGGTVPFVLSEEGARKGLVMLALSPRASYYNDKLKGYLAHRTYHDETLRDLALKPAWWGLGALLVGLLVGIPKDVERARIRRHGQRVKGPEMVTVREFNRRNRSNGIGFLTEERTCLDKLLGRGGHVLRLPRERESEHCLMIGDSGGGKSSLMRQILIQVEERGETAIVYDPVREYTKQFYDPRRRDVILNALDARMPYWSPSDEVKHPAEADTLAESLFPEEPGEKKFFIAGPRKIFAQLLLSKATPTEIIWCLSHEEEIKRLVKETLMEAVLHPGADQQRAGVLGSLNLVADALKLLPRKEETSSVWTATEWSQERRGWLFITSTPETRKALLPLMSLWLDLLVLRLIHQGRTGKPPVWFVLDELATLQHLPQLHTAITENRKSNNPVVLGLHGRSQLEKRYGLDAEVMLSSPATKFYLRTSEPRSAEWISRAIGDLVMARLRESHTRGHFPQERESTSQQVDRSQEPLVLPSEIGGLDNLQGYVKSRNLVVRFSFPYIELPDRQPDLILRPFDTQPRGASTVRAATPTPPPLRNDESPAQPKPRDEPPQSQTGQQPQKPNWGPHDFTG